MMKRAFFRGIFLLILLLYISFAAEAEGAIAFSHESGFYRRGFDLAITAPEGAEIYYTLDGTAADEFCELYEEPLFMEMTVGVADPLSQITGVNIEENFIPLTDFPSAHVIRARGYFPDTQEWTEEICATYFVGYERERLYGDLPIISLMLDERDLFDHEYGIYVLGQVFVEWNMEQTEEYDPWEVVANYTGRGMEWEREAMADFMMGEGDTFCQDIGIRIKGGASRGGTQKSLRLIARKDYGEKYLEYPFFEGNLDDAGQLISRYKSVTLRSGGNDRDFARIRDPLIANLASGLSFETADNRPVIAFINGEYWGMYTLNEEYSEHYIESHYGIDSDHVVTFKTNAVDDGIPPDDALYWDMYSFIAENDMQEMENFARAAEMLDMQSFADYLALTFYIYNQDSIFDNNNWEMWRVRDPEKSDHPLADGKWRMMLYDSDYSSGIYDGGQNFRDNNITAALEKEYEEGHPGRMILSLMESPAFQEMLVKSLSDLRSLYFTSRRVSDFVSDMRGDYERYIPDTFRRMGPMWVAQWNPEGHLRNNINTISTYFTGRGNQFSSLMQSAFGLKKMVDITVKTEGAGAVSVNGRDITVTRSQKIFYFPEYPITLTAIPSPGSVFSGWKINNKNGSLSNPADPTTQLTFKNALTVTAVFTQE